MSFQAYIDTIKAKTGKSPEDFIKLAETKGFLKNRVLESGVRAGDIVNWLKSDFELGHGHAMAIYAVFKQVKETVLIDGQIKYTDQKAPPQNRKS